MGEGSRAEGALNNTLRPKRLSQTCNSDSGPRRHSTGSQIVQSTSSPRRHPTGSQIVQSNISPRHHSTGSQIVQSTGSSFYKSNGLQNVQATSSTPLRPSLELLSFTGGFSRQRRWSASNASSVQRRTSRPPQSDGAMAASTYDSCDEDSSDFGDVDGEKDTAHDKMPSLAVCDNLEDFISSVMKHHRPCHSPPPWSPPEYAGGYKEASLHKSSMLPTRVVPAEHPSMSSTSRASEVATVLNQILPTGDKDSDDDPKTRDGSAKMSFQRAGRLSLNARTFRKEPKPLMSLTEFRRRLVQKWQSLHKAFTILEHFLEHGIAPKSLVEWANLQNSIRLSTKRAVKKMNITEFSQAMAFFGLDIEQARHFFDLMDKNGDGSVTITEFKTALTDIPQDVLLRDVRGRLVSKHQGIPEALKELTCNVFRPLDLPAFARQLLPLGVDNEEAQSLFALIDADKSGTISIDELRDGLREVSPWISLDQFWGRFACAWPDIAQSSGGGAQARRRGAEKLFALVSSEHRGPLKELPESLSRGAFGDICANLDISTKNALELFTLCATSAKWQCRDGRRGNAEALSTESECDLDDFFDCLHLWSENPLNQKNRHLSAAEQRRGSANDVSKYLAPVRHTLDSLKGQLASGSAREDIPKSARRASALSGQSTISSSQS